jgi:Domain of unknown function (DUF5666)
MNDALETALRRREWLLAALAAIAGCGGGVDSGGALPVPVPPTLAMGAITGFGSIIVNGVRYDESGATIEDDDGKMLSSAQLKLGMQATVLASAISNNAAGVSSATASAVAVRSNIIGPIEAIDRATAQLTVLGQRVAVVASTVFGEALPMGLAALAVADVIEVHGTYDSVTGRYVATRIERRTDAPATYKLRGTVATLSVTARTLAIGMAVIDWSAVAPSNPSATLAPGTVVRITLATTPSPAGIWRATALNSSRVMLGDRDRVEVEGRVTAFKSSSDFEVNGLPVNAASATFANGGAGVVLGAKVEVKGRAVGGVIVAQTVAAENDNDAGGFELHGSIESVDAPAQRFVARGITVVWSAATRFDSSTPADIQIGRQVEVKGVLSADGTRVDATEVHVER